jgi:hypothetical protein
MPDGIAPIVTPPESKNVAADDALKIQILRIQAKINRANRKECFRELFDWLAGRRLEQWPETEEECVRILSDELAQQVYDIALAEGWIWPEQVQQYRVYSEYIHGPGVRSINERSRREAFRLPTVEEARAFYWKNTIWEWQAKFLEHQQADIVKRISKSSSTKSKARGFAANAGDHRKVAEVVAGIGDDWPLKLPQLCKLLQEKGAVFPESFHKLEGADSWEELADDILGQENRSRRERIASYIRYRLKWVSRNPR